MGVVQWHRDSVSSRPVDGRAYIELDGKHWHVYKTEEGQVIAPDLPLLTEFGFEGVELAEIWVDAHVPGPGLLSV